MFTYLPLIHYVEVKDPTPKKCMVIEISLAIIAACMVIFVIAAIILLIHLNQSIKRINNTVDSLKFHLPYLMHEANKTLTQAGEITAQIKNRVEQTEPLFSSISKTGQLMGNFLNKMHSQPAQPEPNLSRFFNEERQRSGELGDWLEWLGLGVVLWQKIKKRIEK